MNRTISRLAAIAALGLSLEAAAAEVLRDNFSDDASGWPNKAATRSSALGFAVYTDSGKYQMTPVADNTFGFIAAPRQAGGDNVRIEADMFVYAGLGAGAGGVACRFRDHDNFYAFIARGDATLLIMKIKDGKATPLAKGSVKSVMQGAVDTRFTVECKDDTLRLAASTGSTITAKDSDFRGGTSGLVVIGEKLAGTSATFDNFVLNDLGGGQSVGSARATAATPAPHDPRPAARTQAPARGGGDTGLGAATAGATVVAGMPTRVRSLRPGQALVVVEHDGFRGEGLIERKPGGGLTLAQKWHDGGAPGMNLYFNHSGDSFYTTLRTGAERGSAIATWNVEIDVASGMGTCQRMDLYKGKPGTLSVWNAKGERVCAGG